MRFVVTGAAGFLGWRSTVLLSERGHDVVALTRPHGAARTQRQDIDVVEIDAGDPAARRALAGADAVFHFAGVPDPARARLDPARAVRENAGATLNLLEGCAEHGPGLLYPSTVRAAVEPPPDAYAISKRLGEHTCRLHAARASIARLTSVFGPGQVAWEGATGAIARFAAAALEGKPIVIPGDPERLRDFAYVDDVVPALERMVADDRWNETLTLASGIATPLRRAAELVRAAVGSSSPIEAPGGKIDPGENRSYEADASAQRLAFPVRPFEEAIQLYVNWLRRHPAAESRTRG